MAEVKRQQNLVNFLVKNMFFPNTQKFSEFNLNEIEQFINCWSTYYRYAVKKVDSDELIDYFAEINLNNELSSENVVNLLRWKDAKFLTNQIMSGPNKGSSNDRVDRVLLHLDKLNQFRNFEISEVEFKETTHLLFPNGIIWGVFIFHICQPFKYPIADQHVFRSYNYHKACQLPIGWAKHEAYTKYFNDIISALYGDSVDKDELIKRKTVDNALMVYGQFLKKYEIPN